MKSVLTAIAEFQYECPTILKDTQGYGYKYTDISTIIEQIKPLLKKHKLGFYQGVDGQSLKTVVFHTESGESITESALIPHGVSLKGMNDFQVLGSAITYMRRYQLSAMLGIVTDKDIDGAGEQVTNDIPYTQKNLRYLWIDLLKLMKQSKQVNIA